MTTTLRPLEDADLDAVFAWESDARANRMAVFTREDSTDRAAFDVHYRKVRANKSALMRAIEHDGGLASTIASFTLDGEREVTYWVDRSVWGRGVATEALRQFLALETTRPLTGRVAASNAGSRRVLEKNGFRAVDGEPEVVQWRGAEVTEVTLRLT